MVTPASGGYVIHDLRLIRARDGGHTAALDRPVSRVDLASLNAIQATPWRVNTPVLDVALAIEEMGGGVAGIPAVVMPELPARMDDAVWTTMDEQARKQHIRQRREVHDKRATVVGKRQSVLDILSVADEMRDYPSIWYPHNRDFRGRMYPAGLRGPHPQSSDLGKNVIEFARGLSLGPSGLYWLCVRAANAAGKDKLPLDARVDWVFENRELIEATAAAPLDDLRWADFEEPWAFLATAFELSEAFALDDPEEFVSHLPVPMDGTCNGLQHLSAMGLDPVGAEATNLRAGGERQDIYMRVAEIVNAKVEADAEAGRVEAIGLRGTITRKTVKRATMTTPYGVTDRGIRMQLVDDGMVETTGEVKQGQAAEYLKDCIVEALDTTIKAARDIMAWLQEVAKRLADAGLPFDWITPTGSMVRQAYRVKTVERIRTMVGQLALDREVSHLLTVKKQALGAAPNFIHSFDAAHLSLTVSYAAAQGMQDFAMIHDSFGTHAGNTDALAAILRRSFVDIYEVDWIERTREYVAGYAPHVELPEVPLRGDFDIAEVIEATFFFS